MNFPEHDKLRAVSETSQIIGEFLEWLQGERDIVFARYNLSCPWIDRPDPVSPQVTTWLAEFFGIDLTKLEEEKRAMLETLRNA